LQGEQESSRYTSTLDGFSETTTMIRELPSYSRTFCRCWPVWPSSLQTEWLCTYFTNSHALQWRTFLLLYVI